MLRLPDSESWLQSSKYRVEMMKNMAKLKSEGLTHYFASLHTIEPIGFIAVHAII